MRPHCEPMELIDYARGRLSRRRAGQVREHCAKCEDCGNQLAAVILLRRDAEVVAPVWRVDRRWVPAAVAAALVLAVGVSWFVRSAPSVDAAGAAESPALSTPVVEATSEQTAADETSVVEDGTNDSLPGPGTVAELGMLIAPAGVVLAPESMPAAPDANLVALREAYEQSQAGDIQALTVALERFEFNFDVTGSPLLGAARFVAGDRSDDTVRLLQAGAVAWWAGVLRDEDRYAASIAVLCLGRLEHERGRADIANRLLGALAPREEPDRVVLAAQRQLAEWR